MKWITWHANLTAMLAAGAIGGEMPREATLAIADLLRGSAGLPMPEEQHTAQDLADMAALEERQRVWLRERAGKGHHTER